MQGGASGPSLRKDTEAYEENNEMEFFVIDVHETRQKEEYITQLQLQVCQTK